MRLIAVILLPLLFGCSPESPSNGTAAKPYRDATGRAFGVVSGHMIDPPISGAAFRMAIAGVARASTDTATCTDPAITQRREALTHRLDVQLARLRALGLKDEIAAGQADLGFASQAELQAGCSPDPEDNRRSLDRLEHWIGLLDKWGT